jgi:hypothetical protein
MMPVPFVSTINFPPIEDIIYVQGGGNAYSGDINNMNSIDGVVVNNSFEVSGGKYVAQLGLVYKINDDIAIIHNNTLQGPSFSNYPIRIGTSYNNGATLSFEKFLIDSNYNGNIASAGSIGAAKSICIHNGIYALSCGNNILNSSDGLNWQIVATSSAITLYPNCRKIIYVEDGPTLGGTNSYFYYMDVTGSKVSTNNINFTSIATTNLNPTGTTIGQIDIIWCSGLNLFVRCGSIRDNSSRKLHWSSDGENWNVCSPIQAEAGNMNWTSIAYSPTLNKVVVVQELWGSIGNTAYIGVSTDGKNYAVYPMPINPSKNTSTNRSNTTNVKWVEDSFLLFVSTSTSLTKIYRSYNGINWSFIYNATRINDRDIFDFLLKL